MAEVLKPIDLYRIMHADEKWAAKNSKVNLCFLASAWAPHCDEEALRTIVDWNNWVCCASLL